MPFEGQFIGLKSSKHDRFVKMKDDGGIGTSGVSTTLPNGWVLERFKVVNVGGSNFALHNTEMNRFLTLKLGCRASGTQFNQLN